MSTTPGAFRAEEEPEVASHYQIVRAPPASDLNRKSMCRNWECGGTEFENDYRSGDRVCRSCGAVQNARNCESQEEEHRTFADDDKKDSKQRTSRSASTGVGMAKLEQANQLAHGQADGDELTHKQRKKIADYKDKVTVLSDALELTDTIKFDGHMLCEDLVRKQHEHDVQCGKGGTCRLTLRLRPAAVIAAALLKEAMRKNGIDRLFEELKKVLKGDDVDAADTGKTISALALLRAFEELVQPKLRNGKQNRPLPQLPKLSVADIAQEAGLTEKTLTQHMRHEDLPWPTLLLQDLAHRLAPPPPFAFRTEAQKILDRILQALDAALAAYPPAQVTM
ncbi:hypothetical protein Ctob_003673 [Chrysochromulina tobinii]|uniref:Uncharacterized protein n=1 Tax=Chrysochromulina tobinii TaxID=1460289 RepID=A0A0M0J3V3_9EUKA|nr:hypothetical protein Ctob_003673 [Chrysochromulina tobinii]|eukprot:KOO20923.1 hypothetical protein Ctob_003673 [Chrysochromulina sp. CCMP291]